MNLYDLALACIYMGTAKASENDINTITFWCNNKKKLEINAHKGSAKN